uniref:Uncharacterized protein n=1 Tax=viral metagenome TaxID=1070528 RepID=A0A6C0HRR5_9ZZZZ
MEKTGLMASDGFGVFGTKNICQAANSSNYCDTINFLNLFLIFLFFCYIFYFAYTFKRKRH